MEIEELEIIHLELKYCERCGGLWLRPEDTDEVYCGSCSVQMSAFAVAVKRNKPRLLLSPKIEIDTTRGRMLLVCCDAGEA